MVKAASASSATTPVAPNLLTETVGKGMSPWARKHDLP